MELMMTITYVLKPSYLGPAPEIAITEQEYDNAERCHRQVYEAFEIELAFDFLVANYIEIEKYIAEHLVLDMVGQSRTEDQFRQQHWGFIRSLNNWLASISFWSDLTRQRLISICGRQGNALNNFEAAITKLKYEEFVTAFLFHLRNYSQHGGFPLTGLTMGGSWDDDRSRLTFSANYTLNYEQISFYFERGATPSKGRKSFGKRINTYSEGKPFDLKPIIRESLGCFGKFMDEVRGYMATCVDANEFFVVELIKRYQTTYPNASILSLSVMPVDQNGVVKNKAEIVPVRCEFINRAKEMRQKNNGMNLMSIEKRMISNK